ncbi:MAG: dTDP-glucose 4,6-dehydratase, partial [Cyanobacteriota bacterium]
KIVNLDNLTYAANPDNLKDIENNNHYCFIKGDICNADLVNKLFNEYDLKGVINFAAESHVDNSIINPEVFVRTNIYGTLTLLESARKHWLKEPNIYNAGYENCKFHHISTDEVYGSLGETGYFTEHSPYRPNSPYSASKAGADLLVRSYYKTFGLNTLITNSSNNFGPAQHKEKLIPTIIRKALALEPIPIYADGSNIRDWIYVLDHCNAIDIVFHSGIVGNTYNIGCRNEYKNICIANKICELLDKYKPLDKNKHQITTYKDLITFVKDRPGHDKRYAIDPAKIESELKWKIETNFDMKLEKTVKWFLKNNRF